MGKADVSDESGNGSSPIITRDSPPSHEQIPANAAASREDLTSYIVAGLACGMPEPNSPAWDVWLDVVYQRPNLPPHADKTPGGHQAGEFFFDDPDAERAWIALSFAHRRWAERATLSGARGAVAIERLLRLAMLAGRGQLPQEERDRRIQAVVKVADGASEYLREWTAANRKEFMDGLVRDARDRASQSARSRGMKDPVAAATDLERAAYARLAVDWMMFHMRSRFHVPEEFWEASDLARLVLSRASDALMGWSSSAAIYPNRATVCDGGDSLPSVLVGTLSRGLSEETHTGTTPATRAARANSVACAVAAELNKRREDMYEKLFAAECSDMAAPSPRGPTTHRDKARQWATKRIAVCAFAGLYVANGESTGKARRKAENMIGRKG